MSDFITKFGRRQDAIKAAYNDEEMAAVRPLGNISLIGSVLIDLHHRAKLGLTSVEEEWEKVSGLAEWEWDLICGPLMERLEQKRQEQQETAA